MSDDLIVGHCHEFGGFQCIPLQTFPLSMYPLGWTRIAHVHSVAFICMAWKGDELETMHHSHSYVTQFAWIIHFDLPFDSDWRSSILSEVQNQSSTKLPSNKSVLVLGDNTAGKTTLIAKLQGVEDPKKGAGLEYAYIDVRDEYRDGKWWMTWLHCD